jgi:hypothetical protein
MTQIRRNGAQPVVVPTRWFAAAIEPLIEKLNIEIDGNTTGNNYNTHKPAGAIDTIASRASHILGEKPEAMSRRLFSVRKCDYQTLGHELAEAFAMALDTSCEQLDVPAVPGSDRGAYEMVDAWDDIAMQGMSEFEKRQLAKKLRRFTIGLLQGLAVDAEGIPAAEAVGAFLRAFAPAPVEEAVAA